MLLFLIKLLHETYWNAADNCGKQTHRNTTTGSPISWEFISFPMKIAKKKYPLKQLPTRK